MADKTTEIDSFILRFTSVKGTDSSPDIRGTIRHIQSSEIETFTHWRQVELFIKRYIPFDSLSSQENSPANQ